MLLSHGDEGTPQRLRLGTTLQNVFAEGVAFVRRRIGGGEEISVPLTPSEAFRRYDETPDEEFYSVPRLVTHIDERAIAAVTQLYREHLPPGGAILDLMSSWVSHLPPEVTYSRVVGLGMNEVELKENLRLDEYMIQDLNVNPKLPFRDGEFDGVGICVSIDYLTRPFEVMREVGRVLKAGSPAIISFSNRCFPDKAVAIWHQLDDRGHVRLVEEYLREAGNFENVRGLDRSPRRMFSDPLYAVVGESTGAQAI
jgi:SAM-dependent methyltransferase